MSTLTRLLARITAENECMCVSVSVLVSLSVYIETVKYSKCEG